MTIREFALDTSYFLNEGMDETGAMLSGGLLTLDVDSMTVTAVQGTTLVVYPVADPEPIPIVFTVPAGRNADGALQVVSEVVTSQGIPTQVTLSLAGLGVGSPRHFRLGENGNNADVQQTWPAGPSDYPAYIATASSAPPSVTLRRFFAGFAIDGNGDMPSLQTDDRKRAEQWIQAIAATCTDVTLAQIPANQTAAWRAYEVSGRDDQWDLHYFMTDDGGRAAAQQAEMEKTLQDVQLVQY